MKSVCIQFIKVCESLPVLVSSQQALEGYGQIWAEW